MQPYETAPLGGGLVYYKTPITTAHNGFVSAFTYLPSVCDSVNKGGPGGFSFFLTTDNITANWGVTSRPDEFALNSLNNVVMAGYSQTFNEFLLCSWNDAPRNYALRDVCPKLSNTSPKYACSTFDQSPTMVATYFFKVIYDKETLSIYVSDVLKFSQPLKLKPATYTIGFSANANSTYPFFRHQFTSWNFTTFETGVSNSFKYDARQVNDDRDKLQLIGQAALASDSIQMVPATDYVSGAIISTNAFAAHRGFRTRFTWTASQCADGPGDGFAFFLTPNYPVAKRITYSYGNTLGVSNLENVFAIGFSALRNELRACQWAQPRLDCQSADCITQSSALGSFKCNTTYNVEIQLFGQELKVYFNQKLVYSNLKAVGLTPGFYYAGITAANGDKIMRQDITDWSFELWNGYTQRFTSTNATLFQTFGNAFAYPSELLLTAGTLGGLVVTRQQTTVGTGFRTTFDFYTQFSLAYDGATFFLSKAYPSAQQLNDSSGVHGYGIRTLPRTMALVITLSDYMPGVLSMDHYICQWDTPLASSAFPQSCGSFYTALTQSRVTHRYNIQYNFNTLEVYVNETLRSAMPLSLDWDSYYVGFSGYGIGFNPYIRQWQFNASDDYTIDKKQFSNFTTSDILPNSNASVVPTQLQLTKPNYTSVGAAIHSNRLFAHLGFQSKFSYTATSCTNRNVSLTGLPQGFTFFLSPDVPSDDAVASSRDSGLGIFNVPNIALAVGYDNLKNVFNVCSWDTVDSQFECKSYPKAGAAFSCNTTYVYNLFYNHEILQVFVNYTRVLVHNLKLSVGLQYAGFSATNAADQFAQQSITSWIYASYQPPFGEQFNFASLGDVAFVTLGSADVVDSKLVLTNSSSQAGALFYPQQVRPDLGFNSSFVFLPINCDPIYNGADGFTLFFTKQYPVEENILASAGGQLGIQQQPDVSMFAYSRTFNEFFIANWTSPTTDLLRWFGQNIPNPQSKLACNGVYYFDLLYEHNTLSVYLNFNLVLTAPMNFDPTGYYVGLSGGTGQGYWSQEFRLWRFNSYEL